MSQEYVDSGILLVGDIEMGSPPVRTLRTQTTKKNPSPPVSGSGPHIPIPKTTVSRQVFLEEKMWEELTEAARFHSETFKALGLKEGVSRNDLIESFLLWALESYWDDKGGRPTSKDDWTKKVQRHSEALEKSQEKSQK